MCTLYQTKKFQFSVIVELHSYLKVAQHNTSNLLEVFELQKPNTIKKDDHTSTIIYSALQTYLQLYGCMLIGIQRATKLLATIIMYNV